MIENTRAYCQSLSPDLEPHILPTIHSLQKVVLYQLRYNIDHLNHSVIEADKDAQMGALVQLDARHFAAAKVALNLPQDLIQIGCIVKGVRLKEKELIDHLAKFQAESWCALLNSWIKPGNKALNLDNQLSRRFCKSILIPGAANYALELLAEMQSKLSFSRPVEYCLQAMRANICALEEIPNSQSSRWTMLFFEAEMRLRLGDDASKEIMNPLIISEERARSTIHLQDAVEEVVRIVAGREQPQEIFDAIEEIAVKIGCPQLLGHALATIFMTGTKSPTAADIAELLRTSLDEMVAKPEELSTILRQTTKGLIDARSIDELVWLAEEAIALVPNSPQVRAKVYAWLGSVLKTVRADPHRFLELISDNVQGWESSLAPLQQAALWTERSNTLRMVGRFDEALATIENVLEIMHDQNDSANYCVARLNHAILLRETGAPDLSIIELEALLLVPSVKGRLLISVLDSLALAYHRMGRPADMVHCYEKSLTLAVGPFSDSAIASRANLALSLACDDRYDNAIALLTDIDPLIGTDPTILLTAASAWLTILSNVKGVPKSAFNRMALRTALTQTAKRAKDEGNIQDWLSALRILGGFTELSDNREMAQRIWERVAQICSEYDQSLSPSELLRLAGYAYLKNDINLAHDLLLQLPGVIATHGGQATDIAAVAIGLEPNIRRGLDEIAAVAWDKAETFDDLRFIAEMRRNLVSRSQRQLRESLSPLELKMLKEGISNEVLAALAPISGRVGILEWITGPEWISCFVTVIDSTGEVHAQMLEYPETDLDWLLEKMDTSLRAWHRERPGDPFDIPQWRELEDWLIRELAPHLQEDDHLVIFEHERFSGLPWHVAAAQYWSCSYAGGWASILTLPGKVRTEPATTRLGVALVPVFRESEEVLMSYHKSLAHSKNLSGQLGLKLVTREGKECDREGLIELLAEVDVCKLLCHGHVSLFGHEIDLMLAHKGTLPSVDPLAAKSTVAYQHRFGWRDGRKLRISSPILFTAACSTGLAHVVGVGERVSLLAGLNNAGTRALVAPRWDAVASSVLPVLDEALQLYLGGMTLAAAVRVACQEAQANEPRWIAWTICIEGDWR
ncbi:MULTISPECIES: tetratricopeptide repeat protein [unclassified Halomonas]|nr:MULTISPECIES: tetratricopeptide repeat protein [unclassified Halomonas]